MNINITLIGQMITFAVLVWFTMKYVWPPVTQALNERQKKIADGIAAAAQGQQELVDAKQKGDDIINVAKKQAHEIIEQANVRANKIVDDAKVTADQEGKRILATANSDAELAFQNVKEALQGHVVNLAVAGAEKILQEKVTEDADNSLIDQFLSDLDQDTPRAVS